jgi:alpha-D-ribose 1-methylphosphonate 5-phosphate C-P lyase
VLQIKLGIAIRVPEATSSIASIFGALFKVIEEINLWTKKTSQATRIRTKDMDPEEQLEEDLVETCFPDTIKNLFTRADLRLAMALEGTSKQILMDDKTVS